MAFFEISPLWDDNDRTIRIGRVKLPFLWPPYHGLGGSGARIFGMAMYGKEKRPVIRFMAHWFFLPVCYRFKWAMFHRFHPSHRYHILDTGLEPSYYDCDVLMLNACFALLCRYVEKEHDGLEKLEQWAQELQDPTKQDPNAPPELMPTQGQREDEVCLLYRWWKIERPAEQKRHDALLHSLYGDDKRRTSFVPDEANPNLYKMVCRDFDDAEAEMYKEFRALEKKIADDEQKMLHRLIEIRRSLWT